MVARIKHVAKASAKLDYNEQKVRKKKAECIYAGNFVKDAAHLTMKEKRQRFDRRAELNQRAINKGLHIVIQFAQEDILSNETMVFIAGTYMEQVGFGRQPYLVYRHFDTTIPHLHIVTTPIFPNGAHFQNKDMARNLSLPACKAIERDFGLIQADGRHPRLFADQDPVRKIRYGEYPSEAIIAHTLRHAFKEYRFRTLPELNAVLRQYNLMAREGLPGSRLRLFRGLQYHILDDNGHTVGAPIKASNIDSKPTLKYLETLFEANAVLDKRAVLHTGWLWETVLKNAPTNPTTFQLALRRSKLALAPDYDGQGKSSGLLLVNLATRVVINTKELGPGFELPAIRNRLGFDPLTPQQHPGETKQKLQQHRKGHHL